MENLVRIALIGLPGSGKTWFIAALARSFLRYATLLPADFFISLTNINDSGPVILSPAELSQDHVQDHLWELSWRNKNDHRAYTEHTHQLLISDLTGSECAKLGMSGESMHITETLHRADLILFLIDDNNDGSEKSKEENQKLIDLLRKLYVILRMNKNSRFLGFCFTKFDIGHEEPEHTLNNKTLIKIDNIGMLDLINYASNIPGLTTDKFVCSSAGFLPGSMSNFDSEINSIKDVAFWQPWNVADPFLWFLERMELSRIGQVGNSLARLFYRRSRLKYYHRYSLYNAIRDLWSANGAVKN